MIMMKLSTSKLSTFLLMAIQTAGFILMIVKLHYNPSSTSKTEQSHLLIISSWRSGSSFTGQLFSQHPDVFYMMEPGWHIWSEMRENKVEVLHMAIRDLVRSVFLCDMSVYDAYIPRKGKKSDLFQWETSRALCSPPACDSFQRNDIIPQLHCKTLCGNYPFETIQKACKTYNVIAIKEVRFFDLKVLNPLLQDPSLNLQILHLVRDPRAVFKSRLKVNSQLSHDSSIILRGGKYDINMTSYKVMEKVCKSQAQIYETATLRKLHKRYMMVRYEDIVQDPLGKAKEMYEFAKLRFTSKLRDWVYNMTRGKGNGATFVISSRDALNISRAWRTSLPFNSVKKVQDLCSNAMGMFGYKMFHDESEQKDLSLAGILPMPKRL